MKILRLGFVIIKIIFLQSITVVTDTRNVLSPVSSKTSKRQFVNRPIQDTTEGNSQPTVSEQSTEFQRTQSYKETGCFKDTETRAIPILEGSDPELTGFYKERVDPVGKCARVARSRGYQMFAIQNGGMCLSGPDAHNNYKVHGSARDCKDGKGGPWANDVYIFNDFPLTVYVFTGNLPKAATDANVYITITGSMGSSRKIALELDGEDHNPFEAGQKDVFNIHTTPLGTISRITIGHDNTGAETAGWYLEKVIIKDAANNMYKFQVNRWLARDEDDGEIERELSITATINPGLYKPLGCFKERTDLNKERAVPSLEGRDEILDGQGEAAYNGREFPIEKCADAARRRGYVMFAIQDGGLCASSKEIQNTYDMYGSSDDCRSNGTGTDFSSTVYVFADQEPGFKDAEDTSTAVAKGTDSQPLMPSDPAMQVWRKFPQSKPATTENETTSSATPATVHNTQTISSVTAAAGSGTPATNTVGTATNKPIQPTEISDTQPTAPQEIETGRLSPLTAASGSGNPVTNAAESAANKPVQPTEISETQPTTKPATGTDRLTSNSPGLETPPKQDAGNENAGTIPQEKVPEEKPQSTSATNEGSSGANQLGTGSNKATPQFSKEHPSREDTRIPRPGPGGLSPLLETQAPKVYKIAPESRLPGEYTSPLGPQKAFVKQAPEQKPTGFNQLVVNGGQNKKDNGPFTSLLNQRTITSRNIVNNVTTNQIEGKITER